METVFNFPWATTNPDLYILSGSRMYGYSNPESDYDYRGVVIEPPEYLLGREKFEQSIRDHEEDITVWSFRKFFHLIEIESPNVWEMLFAPKDNIIICSDKMQYLLDNKQLFVSKRAIQPMIGFANSELKAAFADVANPKWKRAAHTIRLLHQALQVLQDSKITFPLEISDTLLEIRGGHFTIEEVTKQSLDYLASIKTWMDTSHVPEKKNKAKLDNLYYDICGDGISDFLQRNKRER